MGFFSKVKKKVKRAFKKVKRSARKTLIGEAPKASKPVSRQARATNKTTTAGGAPTPEQAAFDRDARRAPAATGNARQRGTLLTGALGLVGQGIRRKRKTLLGR